MLVKSVIAFGVIMSLSSVAHSAATVYPYHFCMKANGFSTEFNSFCYKNGAYIASNCCVSNPNAGTIGFADRNPYYDSGKNKCAGLTAKQADNGYACANWYQKD